MTMHITSWEGASDLRRAAASSNKSLQGGTIVKGLAVPKIELGYNASVLMFNWDSAFPFGNFLDRDRALGNMPAAAISLGKLLSGIKDYRQANPA